MQVSILRSAGVCVCVCMPATAGMQIVSMNICSLVCYRVFVPSVLACVWAFAYAFVTVHTPFPVCVCVRMHMHLHERAHVYACACMQTSCIGLQRFLSIFMYARCAFLVIRTESWSHPWSYHPLHHDYVEPKRHHTTNPITCQGILHF